MVLWVQRHLSIIYTGIQSTLPLEWNPPEKVMCVNYHCIVGLIVVIYAIKSLVITNTKLKIVLRVCKPTTDI